MIKFEIGKQYFMRFITDSNCKVFHTVTNRTEKCVWLDNGNRYTIKQYDGMEIIYPLGKYSMAPSLRAENVVEQILNIENVVDFNEYKIRRII
jgi:hypothetical protein